MEVVAELLERRVHYAERDRASRWFARDRNVGQC